MSEVAQVECEMAAADVLFSASTLALMARTPGLEMVIQAERERIKEARDKLEQVLQQSLEVA